MIRLTEISRVYRLGSQDVHALVGIHETIGAGEHVAIMGPSGSGKSTLLNTIGCLDRPTSGSYLLAGRDVARLSDAELTQIRRHEIGFVFQFFHLVPRLTAAENVALPLVFAGVPRSERNERVADALERVGLTARGGPRPNELSGGESQRVALARATIMRPKILLADEPTGNLDTKSGRVVLDLLDELNDEGLTLIVVTHDAAVARRADRILVLVDGRIKKRLDRAQVDEVVILLGEHEADDEASA
jgi:putative ABC transport system ATP-binding protein